MYIIQRLSFFFEKSFFFLFSEARYPRLVFFQYLEKKKPNVLVFHIFKNRINLNKFLTLSLNFITNQFDFFLNSLIFKKKANLNMFNLNFFNKKINFFFFFFILNKFFFKRFYRFLSFLFFSNFNQLNLIKLNFVFFIFFNKANGFLKMLDLGKFYDWCLYHKSLYKICNHTIIKKKVVLRKRLVLKNKEFKLKRIVYLKKIYSIYKKNYSEFSNWMLSNELLVDKKKNLLHFKNIFLFRLKNFFFKKFSNNLKDSKLNLIKFSDSSMNKYISYKNLNKFNFFFLRKNRIFNKSRYSRNRQLYRTGFYWCLWLNIIIVYGLFFLFYRFTFNFGYMWWGLMILFYSFIFSKVCKYNFYNIFVLLNEFRLLINWFGFLLVEVAKFFDENMIFTAKKTIVIAYFSNYKNKEVVWGVWSHWADSTDSFLNAKTTDFMFRFHSAISSQYSWRYLDWYLWIRELLFLESGLDYEWRDLPKDDTSWFRYKTIIHFFTELGRYIDSIKRHRTSYISRYYETI
jgi:hypothetical protein